MRLRETVVTALVIVASARSAGAQPEDRRAAAQALFEQGKALVEAGRFKEACPKLADSQRLDPGIGTSLWLADCYENNGQTASAWAQFKEAAAAAAMQKDAREKLARARAENLEKKLARLLIVVTDQAKAAGVIVRRDGLDVGSTEIGNPLPVDPGPHEVTASAPGRRPWRTTVTIAAQPVTTTVSVPPLDPLPEAPAAAASAPAPSGAREEPAGGTQRAIGLVLAGLGVASAGVGTYFSFDAKAKYDRSNDSGHCNDNRCDADGKRLRSDATTEATIATIAIGAGAAAIIGGAILYFTAPRSHAVSLGPQSLVVRF